jgi:hypothetical protein
VSCKPGAGQYGFWQQWNGSTTDVAENHFEQCDFTGEWVAASVRINDYGNNSNITVFSGCVFGAKADTSTPPPNPPTPTTAQINIEGARWTSFVGCELGGNINIGSGVRSVVGSYGFGPPGINALGAQGAGNFYVNT